MNYSQEAATIFCKKHGFPINSAVHEDVAKMIDDEVRELERTYEGKKIKRETIIEDALDKFSHWYETGLEYDTSEIHHFVASHRRACVYAIFLRKAQESQGFTVILLYPDYISDDHETYTGFSESDDLEKAITEIREKAVAANTEEWPGGECFVDDPTDFKVIAVFKGNLTPEASATDF